METNIEKPNGANTPQASACGGLAGLPCSEFLSKLIEDFEDDCDSWQIDSIVPHGQVKGNRQDCPFFGHKYVDQSGPGIMGDDYSGYQYIPMEGQYLKVWYAC